MKKLLILLLLILSTTAFSSFNDTFDKQVRSSIFQAETAMRKEVNQLIIEKTKRGDISIDVVIEIDRELYFRNNGLTNLKKISKAKILPGLDFDQNLLAKKMKNLTLTTEEVFENISNLNITVESKRNFNNTSKEAVSKYIKSYLRTLAIPKTNINFAVRSAAFGGEGSEEEKAEEVVPEPVDEGPYESGNENELLSTPFIIILAAILVLFLVVTLIIVSLMKSSASSLANDLRAAIGSLEGSMGAAPPAPALPQSSGNNQKQNSKLGVSTKVELASGYELLTTKIKALLANNPEAIGDVTRLIVDDLNVKLFLILADCVDGGQKNEVLKLSTPEFKTAFNSFLREEGSVMLDNYEVMTDLAQELYNLLWLSTQDKGLLKQSIIVSRIKKLSNEKVANLIEDLNDNEMSALMNYIEPELMAKIINDHSELLEKFSNLKGDGEMTEQVLATLETRINDLRGEVEIDRKESISNYLPHELENKFNQLTGKSTAVLASLSDEQESILFDHLNALDMGSLRSLLPGLPNYLVTKYIDGLPDIKAKRLRYAEMEVNEMTFQLKNNVIQILNASSKA